MLLSELLHYVHYSTAYFDILHSYGRYTETIKVYFLQPNKYVINKLWLRFSQIDLQISYGLYLVRHILWIASFLMDFRTVVFSNCRILHAYMHTVPALVKQNCKVGSTMG